MSQKRGGSFAGRDNVVFDVEGALGNAAIERKSVDESSAACAWKGSDLIEKAAVKTDTAGCISAEGFIGSDARGENVFGTKTGIHMRERPETANHESGGDDQKDGEGNFGDDQGAAKALRDRNCGATTAGLEGFGEGQAGGLQSRSQTAGETGRESERSGEEKDAPIELDVQQAGRVGGKKELKKRETPGSEEEAKQCTQGGEQNAFREKLTEDTVASCTHGGADSELFFASRGAGEHEIRNVRAGYEEHQGDGAEKHEQANAHVGDHAVLQRNDANIRVPAGRHRPGEKRGGVRLKRTNFRAGLREGRARTETADDRHEVARPIVGDAARIVVERNPDLRFCGREAEARGHDADDLTVDAFEFDGAAKNCWVAAKTVGPEGVAEDDVAILTCEILGREKSAAELCVGAENGKKLGRDIRAGETNGFAGPGEVEFVAFGVSGEVHRADLLAHGDDHAARIGSCDSDELFGMGIGKPDEENSVDEAEDGGVCADAEGQREDSNGREAGILAEQARAVANVL